MNVSIIWIVPILYCVLYLSAKNFLWFKFLTAKEVLVSCRIQAQAPNKQPQEVASLWMQKEVFARALLFLGCTVLG